MQPKHIAIIDSYVQGMISIANERLADDQFKQHGCPPMIHWLEDFRTIGFKTPRQLGALYYVHQLFVNDPEGLLIVRDHVQRDMVRDSFTREGKFIVRHLVVPGEEIDRGLPSSVMNRIITIDDFQSYLNAVNNSDDPEIVTQWKGYWRNLRKVKHFYLAEGTHIFRKIKPAKFYQYMAAVALDVDGLIIVAQ
jgi:hypothetical protein